MSRGYSRAGGGLSIILAIIGTLIVVVVGIFLYSKISGNNAFSPNAEPTPTMMLTTPEPVGTPVPSPTLVAIVTPEPTETPVPEASTDILQQTATPAPVVTAAPNYETVTVAVASLKVRSGPGSSNSDLGSVKYKQTYEVTSESGKWVQIRYNNTYGWIYTGYDSSGDLCAVRGSSAVPSMPEPDAPPSFLKDVSVSGDKLTITFTTGVYGNSEHTSALSASHFTVTEGGSSIPINAISHASGGNTATLTIGHTSGGAIKVSIAKNTVYNSVGTASPAGSVSTGASSDNKAPTGSATLSSDRTTITITFSEPVQAPGGGDLGAGAFTPEGGNGAAIAFVSHSGNTVKFSVSGGSTGSTISIKPGYQAVQDEAGNYLSDSPITVAY